MLGHGVDQATFLLEEWAFVQAGHGLEIKYFDCAGARAAQRDVRGLAPGRFPEIRRHERSVLVRDAPGRNLRILPSRGNERGRALENLLHGNVALFRQAVNCV